MCFKNVPKIVYAFGLHIQKRNTSAMMAYKLLEFVSTRILRTFFIYLR